MQLLGGSGIHCSQMGLRPFSERGDRSIVMKVLEANGLTQAPLEQRHSFLATQVSTTSTFLRNRSRTRRSTTCTTIRLLGASSPHQISGAPSHSSHPNNQNRDCWGPRIENRDQCGPGQQGICGSCFESIPSCYLPRICARLQTSSLFIDRLLSQPTHMKGRTLCVVC
jgi:hypothetical protein